MPSTDPGLGRELNAVASAQTGAPWFAAFQFLGFLGFLTPRNSEELPRNRGTRELD
jgi:hypothetical protein